MADKGSKYLTVEPAAENYQQQRRESQQPPPSPQQQRRQSQQPPPSPQQQRRQSQKPPPPHQQQKSPQKQPPQEQLNFVIRPRYGNKFYIYSPSQPQQQQQQREAVLLSSVLAKIDKPASQAEALQQLGIRLVSRSRVQLHLQEHQPGSRSQQLSGNRSSANLDTETQQQQDPSGQQQQGTSMELQTAFTTRQPVLQPIDIRVGHLRDVYIEADTAYCCLLEASTPFGDQFSVPVLGRGSFNYLGDAGGKSETAAQREHCISGVSAGFLQRAALSITVLLCLCELSREDEKTVVDFYRQADKTFGYGYGAYIDYLVYCCQTDAATRDSYLKYICLEFNNRSTQDRMTQALTHFVETRQPTNKFYKQLQQVMTLEELEKDREANFSVRGRASKASLYLKNAGKSGGGMGCCPCNTM